ncbi:MAG TPA: YidB family protein [Steroidobacteraceae bacterium]
MGLFDGVMGGVVGALVTDVLQKHGGVQGVVQQFERQGFGSTVRSWVSTGPYQPISAEQLHQALGPELIQQLAAKTGLPVAELTQKLAQMLPQAVDRMTPDGAIPMA